jgi:hypothetical protein
MRTKILAVAIAGGLLAACSADVSHTPSSQANAKSQAQQLQGAVAMARTVQAGASIAGHPDHGTLFAYEDTAPIAKGAYTWHQVALSEAHAMRAVATGTMEIKAPNGQPIRLKYDHSVEHGDGNWTWVGRPEGSKPGTEAIITFGEKAVFGRIPYGPEPLEITTVAGKTYAIDTDAKKLAATSKPTSDRDFLVPSIAEGGNALASMLPKASAAGAERMSASSLTAQAASPASVMNTIDIVLGYTNGFATRLGGTSQANTRLQFLVDLANQAYTNSQIDGRLRLVNTVQVTYPDNTANRATLFELSGMNCTDNASAGNLPSLGADCTFVGQPAALQSLANAREAYGADLVALVRTFQDPENGSCGLGWMNGGGQSGVDASDAAFGFSVVSDSSGGTFPDPDTNSTCRSETLAHETGHNLGLQHDIEAAQGANMTLDPDEYGAYPYSFGYSTAESAGNFYTVMSVRRTGQNGFLVFANPRITFCGGLACGTLDTADNWRSLGQTLPIVARFRQSMVPINGTWARGDYNGDGQDDLVWRNRSSGVNSMWRSGNSATAQAVTAVNNQSWTIVGSGDFDGDGASDLLWRNAATGQNQIWRSGNSATAVSLGAAPAPWTIAGVGDFDNDGKDDLLWRNPASGANSIWRSGNYASPMAISAVGGTAWSIVGVGDFDGDGRSDILWRNTVSGGNSIWKSGSATTGQVLGSVADQAWVVAGVGDFNADGKSDILWRNLETGVNSIWRSGNYATPQVVTAVNNPTWVIVGTGDFNGDGADDIVWRNLSSGANQIWRGGNSATVQAVTSVPVPWWIIAG